MKLEKKRTEAFGVGERKRERAPVQTDKTLERVLKKEKEGRNKEKDY